MTIVQEGRWKLLPGAVYGNTTLGSVTVGPSGTLVFSISPENFPLLQGQSLALNGQAGVEGAEAVSKTLGLGGVLSQAVAFSGTPI